MVEKPNGPEPRRIVCGTVTGEFRVVPVPVQRSAGEQDPSAITEAAPPAEAEDAEP